MKELRHSLVLSLFAFIVLTTLACRGRQEAAESGADTIVVDTTMLRVAVMPALNCLPVYYAERSGLIDSLGLDMVLMRYDAQMDIDTAILRGHADIAFTDLIRVERLSKQTSITPLACLDEPLSLVSLKTKRVKQVNQMKEQMIAVSRLSATDYWCDRLLDSSKMSHDHIYRPQVNDVRLRAEMLCQGLIDAAMLGEPYSTWMTMLGHKLLYQSKGKQPQLYAWAATAYATPRQQREFLMLLDSALVHLRRDSQAEMLRDILKQDYQLPPALADTMELQPLAPAKPVREEDVDEVRRWLRQREQIAKKGK